MRKENLVTAKGGEVTAPLTRARSAALRACGRQPPLKAPIQQNHKRTLQGNPNNTDLEENNNNAPNNACCCKRKRRAVLQDVGNFCCKCSQGNCLNAAKIQAKMSKPTRKGQVKVCKVAPSVALEAPLFQAASETKILQETVKIESKSKEVISSIDSEEMVSLQLSTIKECDTDDHRLKTQSFGMPSHPQFPPKKVKGGLSGDMTISSNLDIIDIDADLKEPQLCSIYAPDIYSNLRDVELARSPHFMETIQQDITQSMRGMLVNWLVKVSERYQLASNTLYLTIYLIDWFLTGNCIERQRLQLLGITCMLLALKYEEGRAPHVEELCLITGNTYAREDVLELEIQVWKYLGFQLFSPTTKTFLSRFLRAAQASYMTPSLELEYLANYLAESTLIDYGFLKFLPSAIAASAVFLARWTLDQSNDPWNPTLEHYTSYKASDLKIIVLAIQDIQLNTNGRSVIRMKYRQQRFKSVAALSSPKLLETLFKRENGCWTAKKQAIAGSRGPATHHLLSSLAELVQFQGNCTVAVRSGAVQVLIQIVESIDGEDLAGTSLAVLCLLARFDEGLNALRKSEQVVSVMVNVLKRRCMLSKEGSAEILLHLFDESEECVRDALRMQDFSSVLVDLSVRGSAKAREKAALLMRKITMVASLDSYS